MFNPKFFRPTGVKIQNSKLLSAVFCGALTLLILWLALIPSSASPSGLGWDKLNHAGAIAAATGLAYFSLQPRLRAASWAFWYGTSLGILIEILQGALTTSRAAEWGDVAADLIGAGCAWAAIKIFHRKSAPTP